MDVKSTQRGFGPHSELAPLIVILIILSAVAAPIAKKLGYHPGVGVLAVLALYALYFIYLQIQDYLYQRQRNRLPPRESLTVTAREEHGVTVLDIDGALRLDNCDLLRSQLNQLLNAGKKSIVLDLARLRHIDAAGLGLLVRSCIGARATGGELKLAKPSGQVRRVLESTRLADAIEIYSDEEEAAASFARNSRP